MVNNLTMPSEPILTCWQPILLWRELDNNSHIRMDRDRGRRIKRATATHAGGRLPNRLCDWMQHMRVSTPHDALYISDSGSSNDIASIIGGALVRIFQALRNQINHNIPSCTPAVWVEENAPQHPTAKAYRHRSQTLRLVLTPGRMTAPFRRLTPLREGAYLRKFAEPSDDLHHIACLSSVRACGGWR